MEMQQWPAGQSVTGLFSCESGDALLLIHIIVLIWTFFCASNVGFYLSISSGWKSFVHFGIHFFLRSPEVEKSETGPFLDHGDIYLLHIIAFDTTRNFALSLECLVGNLHPSTTNYYVGGSNAFGHPLIPISPLSLLISRFFLHVQGRHPSI